MDQFSPFGSEGEQLYFAPEHFSIQEKVILNCRFRLRHCPKEADQLRTYLEKQLPDLEHLTPPEISVIDTLLTPPVIH